MAVAKNNLTGASTSAVTSKKKEPTIFDLIEKGRAQFEAALPKHLSGERFVRIAITAVRQNPELYHCSSQSLLGALMTIAQLGLEPGVLGQCYLIPFKNKKLGTVECQLQIGYKGLIELLRRTGQLSDIYAYTVYSNDEFEIEYGLERTLKHKPAFNNPDGRGEIVGFYSVAILKDGTRAFEYMTKKEVIDHEAKYRKSGFKNSVWEKNFEEMAMKTVTKKMLKWLPISIEMLENIRKDDQIHTMNEKTKEISSEYIEDEMFTDSVIDNETGEIIEDATVVDKATDKDRVALIDQAAPLKINLKEVVKNRLQIDFDDMTKEDVSTISNFIDELIEERMK